MKKFLALLLAGILILSGTAFSATVEDALTNCPEESVYMVLKLDDAQTFLKWIFSRENIDTFMPLILASEDSNEILGAIEMISAFAENTPLKSIAILAGLTGNSPAPFFQMAFTTKPESDPIVKKIADGSANSVDLAKLFLGNDSPLASFAESMIKVEKANDNILKIDNELFIKAVDGMIVAGLNEDSIKSSINALEHSDLRLFGNHERKFADKDFAFFHFDPKTSEVLEALADDDDDKKDVKVSDIKEYFDKPLNVELGFTRIPDKFTISFAANTLTALKKSYIEKVFPTLGKVAPVKGGYMNPMGIKSPLFAMSGILNISSLKNVEELKGSWEVLTKNLQKRFGISEEAFIKAFSGAFSLAVADNVTFESFKIPAVYSKTITNPESIFGTLSKSQHFHKVQEGVLQIDSSLSPVPFLVENKGDSLGMYFAELANISSKPELKPAFEALLNREAISLCWVDFAQIQSWIFDPENGVMPMVEPLAKIMGFGEIFDAAKNVLGAELSVPSMAVIGDSFEVGHMEFNIVDVKPENGFFAKLVSATKKFMDFGKKVEDKEDKEEKE